MSKDRIVVTGMGAVSCFGAGVDRLWTGLVEGRSGRRELTLFDASRYRSSLAAEVPWNELEQQVHDLDGLPLESERATVLAMLAVQEALSDASIDPAQRAAAGCIVGTLCASSQVFERYSRAFCKNGEGDRQSFPDADACISAIQLEHLVSQFGFSGPASLVSTACSSSTDAVGYAADAIRAGNADLMVAGGADILSEVVHGGFNAVFSITTDRARPFDLRRTGFVIGEGAGFLVLESLEHANRRGARVYAEILGYGLSNTAFHLTATSEDGYGEGLAVRRCLDDASISADDIDYVNVHGTSTSHNDVTEAKALHALLGSRVSEVPVTSIKPNIGHCMGAAGALEAIATIQCIRHSYIPPMLDSSGDLDAELNFVIGSGKAASIRVALSQSFGFGGACSALAISAPPGPEDGAA